MGGCCMAVMHSLAHVMGCWWHSSTFRLALLCFIPPFLFDSTLGVPYEGPTGGERLPDDAAGLTNRFKAPTRACTHVLVLLRHACMQFDVLTGRAADDIIQRSMPRGPSPWSAHPPSTWQMKMNICGRQPQPSPLTSGVCVYAFAFCVCWSPDVPLVYAARVGTRQPAVSSTSSLPTPPEGAGTSHRMRASRLRKG